MSQLTVKSRSIGRKIAIGAFWTVAMRLSVRLIGLISVIIMARLLVPEDFGVVAKASMVASFLELVTTFGLEAALIHNQRAVSGHYDTVWTIHVVRGVIIAFAIVALATPAAEFFREPALASILWFYALAALLNGLENVGIVDFRKNMEFDKDFRFTLYRKLAGFMLTVSIALVWRSYWAFVIGTLGAATVALCASYLMSPYRPKLSLREWRSLFDFSKWVFLTGLIGSIAWKLDTFILSRFSTTEVVGEYTVSHEISSAASTELAMPIARATMPGLAILNDDAAAFRETYQRTIAVLLLVAAPAGLGLSAVAEQVTMVVLGEKWHDAAELIQVLAIYGVVAAIFAVAASAFMSSGKVKALGQLMMSNLMLRLVFLSAGFVAGGGVGLAIGLLVAGLIQMVLSLVVQQVLGFLRIIELVSDTWRLLSAALIMYFGVAVLIPATGWLESVSMAAGLVVNVLLGAIIYVGVLMMLWFLGERASGPERIIWGFLKSRGRRLEAEDSMDAASPK